MTTPQTIAVTGATGFVGRSVVRALLARGHRVRALVRAASKARAVLPRDPRLELVTGHVFDGTSPAALVREADALVHLIGIIREVRGGGESGPQTFQRMHVDATRVILDACIAAGVPRYLHMSSLGASPDGKALYQRSKFEAELFVRRSGLHWTIFRPSLIHGPDGELVLMIHDMAAGLAPPWYFMPYFAREIVDTSVPIGPSRLESAHVQPICVDDVAWCFAEALQRDITIGEIYNLSGPDTLTWPQLMGFYRDRIPGANTSMPIAALPGNIGALAAKAANFIGAGSLLPFDEGQALMSMQDSVSEHEKVHAHFGFTSKSFYESAQVYATQMQTTH
ncbi:MAG: SDR family oxidoreductase [Phycisphaerales bacterium]